MHSTSTVGSRSSLIVFFILSAFFFTQNMGSIRLCLAKENLCMDNEKEALLSFKQGLKDPSGRLSSWAGPDCCQWRGIQCNIITGNVVKLDLRNPFPSTAYGTVALAADNFTAYFMSCLSGELSSSLLELRYLNYLDLSLNYFDEIPIPKFIGKFKNLRYLNLSSSQFLGPIPPHLTNLSSLNYLDINTILNIQHEPKLWSTNIQWLSGLTSLKYLNMGQVNLYNKGLELLQVINMMPSLEELHLPSCMLQTLPLSLSHVNLTLLSALDLSNNHIHVSSIPNWFSNLTSLTTLDLSNNFFNFNDSFPGDEDLIDEKYFRLPKYIGSEGRVPGFLGCLCRLEVLNISQNYFTGEIHELLDTYTTVCSDMNLVILDLSSNQLIGDLPNSLGKLKNLQQLHLNNNNLSGSVPETFGSLSCLQELDLSFNSMDGGIPATLGQLSMLSDLNLELNFWQGVITEAHFMNLTKLQSLIVNTITVKSLVFNVAPEWNPPFRLTSVELENCLVGPTFSAWLRVQSELIYVKLPNAGIEDTIPEEWFSNLSSHIIMLDLSNNQIKGKLPQDLQCPELIYLDLRNNLFEGSLPSWSTNMTNVYLQNNSFTGPIPDYISEVMPQLQFVDFSQNHLNGTIPSSFCAITSLYVLSLRNNQLSGQLPSCWDQIQNLWVLDVANNSLSGDIPSSFGLLSFLYILILRNNSFEGKIPPSLRNCTSLQILDLGGNRLSGELPLWIGEDAMQFWILRLRSNNFSGTIPKQWCNLWTIHILDLAENNLSGTIPSCLGNLSSLISPDAISNNFLLIPQSFDYEEQVFVVTKSKELEYSTNNLEFVNSIDLSKNHLTGEIPKGITNLVALQTLNFSMNCLTGGIPEEIGNLIWLETLDLSNNKLSGRIPQSLSSLYFLSHLNLSHNNLNGRIPQGNQLQTLNDNSIYEGNPLLCGLPLPVKCQSDTSDRNPLHEDVEDDGEDLLFYGCGFICGLCGVCCTLWKKKSWREAYFKFLWLA